MPNQRMLVAARKPAGIDLWGVWRQVEIDRLQAELGQLRDTCARHEADLKAAQEAYDSLTARWQPPSSVRERSG